MFKSIALLALVGSSIAQPAVLQPRKLKTVVHTVVVTHTAVVTYTGEPKPATKAPANTPVPQPKPAPSSKKQEVVIVTSTPPKATYAPPPPPKSSAAPAPAPAPAGGYMDIVNEYRQKLGLTPFKFSQKLQDNALNTVESSNGKMEHKLNPGTFAQVLAPGKNDMVSFRHVYLGGWLCEMPNLPGIKAECPAAVVGWTHNTDGHAKILIGSYKEIGCAYYKEHWSCDCA